MKELWYHVRYALRLWCRVPDMSLWEAWRYPWDANAFDGNPIEDADEEVSCMYE